MIEFSFVTYRDVSRVPLEMVMTPSENIFFFLKKKGPSKQKKKEKRKTSELIETVDNL